MENKKKNILFIGDVSIKDPIRGTPIRIHKILREIGSFHNLMVCAKDMNRDLVSSFIEYPRMPLWKRLMFFKKIIRRHNIDTVMTSTEINIKLLIALKILTGVKIVIDLHGLHFEELFFFGRINIFKKDVKKLLTFFYLRWYDLLLVVSKKMASYYQNINKNIVVAYGGVDLFEFNEIQADQLNNFTIGYMGNTRSYQGVEYLLEAVSQLKEDNYNIYLNLVVSGDVAEIVEILEKYNLRDCSNIHENVKHSEVNNIIRQSHVLVIPRPSLEMTEYAFPSKLPEYLAVGVPVIITDVGPVEELFSGSKVCIIIDKNDVVDGIKKAIVKFINLKQDEVEVMKSRSIKYVKQNLSWEIIGQKINKSLSEL